jgi:hypothetical protein
MFRAMVWKELRETAGIALMALAAFAFLIVARVDTTSAYGTSRELAELFGWEVERVPFVYGYFLRGFCCIAAPAAVALGLWQTLGEAIHGTYPLLLHRPAGRRWLIGVKLSIGISLYLVCGALAILLYGLWAATPGMQASPFEWSMTVPTWEMWFSMTLLYFGGFLAGIRPGHWYRSRLLPLAAAVTAVVGVESAFVPGASAWPWLIVLAADGLMIAMILFVAQSSDYS